MTDVDDLQSALSNGDAKSAIVLAATLWPELIQRHGRRGAELLSEAAALSADSPPSEALAAVRYGAGLAAFRAGENDRCRELTQSALTVASIVGSLDEQARAHVGLSRADFRDGAYQDGLVHAEAAAALAEKAGARDLAVSGLHMRAEITRARGDYAAAVSLYEQLLAADEEAGDVRSLAMEHYNLGSVLIQHGELQRARQHLRSSLALLDQAPDQTMYTLLGYAGLAAREDDPALAGQLLGAVQAQLDREAEVLDPAEQLELDSHVAAARGRDAAAFDAASEAGRALSLEEARGLVARP